VFADQLTELRFLVERVVDTQGLVAVDAHMHTLKSDGSVTTVERVMSLVAEGVEVAVATDHFFRLDLAPAVEDTGLQDYLKVIAGTEISIRNPLDYEYTLDFNLWPLGPGESGWNAVETLVEEVAPIFDAEGPGTTWSTTNWTRSPRRLLAKDSGPASIFSKFSTVRPCGHRATRKL